MLLCEGHTPTVQWVGGRGPDGASSAAPSGTGVPRQVGAATQVLSSEEAGTSLGEEVGVRKPAGPAFQEHEVSWETLPFKPRFLSKSFNSLTL